MVPQLGQLRSDPTLHARREHARGLQAKRRLTWRRPTLSLGAGWEHCSLRDLDRRYSTMSRAL